MDKKLRLLTTLAFTLIFTSITIQDSYSQFVNFGRNKVQYSDFDWNILQTEHFQIYYYKEEKELAEIGAYYAEESYREHQQHFNHSLIDTVPMIFMLHHYISNKPIPQPDSYRTE